MKINNEKIEEIKVSKVESSGLENVVFLPHRFGNLILAMMISWAGLLLFNFSGIFKIIGLFFFAFGGYSILKAYANREKL